MVCGEGAGPEQTPVTRVPQLSCREVMWWLWDEPEGPYLWSPGPSSGHPGAVGSVGPAGMGGGGYAGEEGLLA